MLNRYAAGFSSRAPRQLKSKEFLSRELKENPEFFKAFPHLQKVFDKDEKITHNETSRLEPGAGSFGDVSQYESSRTVKYVNQDP
jgi:ribosomal protein S18